MGLSSVSAHDLLGPVVWAQQSILLWYIIVLNALYAQQRMIKKYYVIFFILF